MPLALGDWPSEFLGGKDVIVIASSSEAGVTREVLAIGVEINGIPVLLQSSNDYAFE